MTGQTKTRAQVYYEAVEALKAEGLNNADAVRTVADKHGKSVSAIRGSLYQYRTQHVSGNGGSLPRRSRRPRSVADHLAGARESLQAALGVIDREVSEAEAARDAAQGRYEQVTASVAERKSDIEQKLAALS